MVCHRRGPRMAAQMVARAIFMRRQRDGLAGGVVESRGGRVRDLPGNLFGDNGDDKPCVDPCPRQLRLLGRQHVEAGQALEPFEGQLNLPAKAIEGEDVGRREGGGRQRGKEKNVFRRLETARVGLLAALPGVLEQTLLLGFHLLRVLTPDNEAQDQRLRWQSPRDAFVDANFHLAFLRGLSGNRCKQIKRLAVRLQQSQRVPAGPHDEVRTGVHHGPQIARSRIIAITQHDIARPVGEALQVLGTMHVGQLKLIDLSRCQVVADMQAPCRAVSSRLADRRPIERTQAIPGPAPGWHFCLFGNQRSHDVAEPRRGFAQPIEQRWIGQADDPAGLGPRTGLAQRHPEAAIGKRQPQQRLSVLDFPRPREGPTQPRRGLHVKPRRKARAHFRPVIQNLRTNLHPKLESYRDSSCPELNLAQMSSAVSYLVQINSSTATFANVTGSAAPGGATVNAIFAGTLSSRYTILSATGGVNGVFNPAIISNLGMNFRPSLSYDATHAYLDLALYFVPPAGGFTQNQQNVANTLSGSFSRNGSIPLVFGGLTPAGATQISGETATGSQQTTFDAMNQFMGLLTDPFIAGRGDGAIGGAAATPFAEEGDGANAYASASRKRASAERAAYAMFTKAPLAQSYDPRWSVWAAGFGGSQTTDGNVALGSNNTTSRVLGMAAGADYIFSPRTIAGFALAGGGTNFSVANSGTGRSDLFQAGAFIRHNVGPAYISGALAYGWQDITTDRIVTVGGVDRLRGPVNANAV